MDDHSGFKSSYSLTYGSNLIANANVGGNAKTYCMGPRCSRPSIASSSSEKNTTKEEGIPGQADNSNASETKIGNGGEPNDKDRQQSNHPREKLPKRETSLFGHGTTVSTAREGLEFWMYSLIGVGLVLVFCCVCCCALALSKKQEDRLLVSAVREIIVRKIPEDDDDDDSTVPSADEHHNSAPVSAEEQC